MVLGCLPLNDHGGVLYDMNGCKDTCSIESKKQRPRILISFADHEVKRKLLQNQSSPQNTRCMEGHEHIWWHVSPLPAFYTYHLQHFRFPKQTSSPTSDTWTVTRKTQPLKLLQPAGCWCLKRMCRRKMLPLAPLKIFKGPQGVVAFSFTFEDISRLDQSNDFMTSKCDYSEANMIYGSQKCWPKGCTINTGRLSVPTKKTRRNYKPPS